MIRKHILAFLLANSLCLICTAGIALAEHPAIAIARLYAHEGDDLSGINPYIISILALNEVRHARHLDDVRRFILWYFSRINEQDRYGLSGTMYDYTVENGVERSDGRYDSADGYAGLFLHLLHQYVRKTNDLELLRAHWKEIENIARVLVALQDKGGLTRALPDRPQKYLMDDCEAFGGMTGYVALRKRLGKRDSAYYNKARNSLKKAVLAHFYDPKNALFYWALDDAVQSVSEWNRFYPDAFAQLFPVYFGILADKPLIKQSLWINFTGRYEASIDDYPVEQRIIFELTRSTMEAPSP
jgi:hypothetical protein